MKFYVTYILNLDLKEEANLYYRFGSGFVS